VEFAESAFALVREAVLSSEDDVGLSTALAALAVFPFVGLDQFIGEVAETVVAVLSRDIGARPFRSVLEVAQCIVAAGVPVAGVFWGGILERVRRLAREVRSEYRTDADGCCGLIVAVLEFLREFESGGPEGLWEEERTVGKEIVSAALTLDSVTPELAAALGVR
jgi:hypothetical protein